MLSLLFGVQSLVTFLDQVFEQSVEHGLGHGTDGVGYLVDVPTLGDEFVTDLDPGLDESGVQSLGFDTQKFGDIFTFLRRNYVIKEIWFQKIVYSRTAVPSASACSSRPLCLNFMVPMCMTAAVIL